MARFEDRQAEKAYRTYMADCVWGLAHGKAFETRYSELFKPPEPEETRTAEEVIDHIMNKLKGLS